MLRIKILKDACFICSQNRNKFDVRGVDFTKHRFRDHYFLNYLYFIVKIKKENKYDLNAVDSQVLQSLNERKYDFMHIKKCMDMLKFEEDDTEIEEWKKEFFEFISIQKQKTNLIASKTKGYDLLSNYEIDDELSNCQIKIKSEKDL